MKEFPYSPTINLEIDLSNDRSPMENDTAMHNCEKFCGYVNECWGCINDCISSCRWIAVTECINITLRNDSSNVGASQKPGSIHN